MISPLNLSKQYMMVFDLLCDGHHGTYLRYLVQAWLQEPFSTQLTLVVSPRFFTVHPEVVDLVKTHPQIEIMPISEAEEAQRNRAFGVQRGFVDWRIFCQYAQRTHATQAMLMYVDYLQFAIAFGQPAPCPFSAIYFRPAFHYQTFSNLTLTLKDYLRDKERSWRQKALLKIAMRNPQFQTLFCLDPFVVETIRQWQLHPKVIFLPDPVEIVPVSAQSVNELGDKLGIGQNRKVFLLFGVLDQRKGIYQLFQALQQIPRELCQQICILLVGEVREQDRVRIQRTLTEINQALPIEVLIQDVFLPEADVPCYFQLSDVVLAIYQRHVGMSGVLLLAAAAQKPVIASNYGLIGRLVTQYELGAAIDTSSPQQIAHSLIRCLEDSHMGKPEKMQEFADQHLWSNFAETIRKQVSPSHPAKTSLFS